MIDAIRDLTEALGVTPATFDALIILVIIVGGLWALVRLYQDLTRDPDAIEPIQTPKVKFKKRD